MTQFELQQKEHTAALEMAAHDIDGAINRMEHLVIEAGRMLRNSRDANERIFYTDALQLLQMDLSILKDQKQQEQERRGRIYERTHKELEGLKAKLSTLTSRKDIKVPKVEFVVPLASVAIVVILSLVIFFICTHLQESGFSMEPAEDPGFFSTIHQQLCMAGEWVNTQMIKLGFNMADHLALSPEIIYCIIYPALPYLAGILACALGDFLLSLGKRLTLSAVKALRAHREKAIRRKMRKLSQTAMNA